MKNSMKIHKIAGVLCALQSVTNLGSKCNQTPPLSGRNDLTLSFHSPMVNLENKVSQINKVL